MQVVQCLHSLLRICLLRLHLKYIFEFPTIPFLLFSCFFFGCSLNNLFGNLFNSQLTYEIQVDKDINVVHHRSITSTGVIYIHCRRGDGKFSLVVSSIDRSRRIILSYFHPRYLVTLIEVCCPSRYHTGENNIGCCLTLLHDSIYWSHTCSEYL